MATRRRYSGYGIPTIPSPLGELFESIGGLAGKVIGGLREKDKEAEAWRDAYHRGEIPDEQLMDPDYQATLPLNVQKSREFRGAVQNVQARKSLANLPGTMTMPGGGMVSTPRPESWPSPAEKARTRESEERKQTIKDMYSQAQEAVKLSGLPVENLTMSLDEKGRVQFNFNTETPAEKEQKEWIREQKKQLEKDRKEREQQVNESKFFSVAQSGTNMRAQGINVYSRIGETNILAGLLAAGDLTPDDERQFNIMSIPDKKKWIIRTTNDKIRVHNDRINSLGRAAHMRQSEIDKYKLDPLVLDSEGNLTSMPTSSLEHRETIGTGASQSPPIKILEATPQPKAYLGVDAQGNQVWLMQDGTIQRKKVGG